MAYQIIYKKRFTNKLVKVLVYLEKEWSSKAATGFLNKIDHKIKQLSKQPFIGISSETVKDVRSISITRHNRLYYKVKASNVIVLNMYDTRLNPRKNKY